MTTSKFHFEKAVIRALVAKECLKAGFRDAATWWTKMCIYHLALAFFRLSYESQKHEHLR